MYKKKEEKESKKEVKEPPVSPVNNQEKRRLMDDLKGPTSPNLEQMTQKSSEEKKKKSSDQTDSRRVNQTQDSGRVNSESPNSGEKKKMKTTEYWNEDSQKLLKKEIETVTEYADEAAFGYSKDDEPRPAMCIFPDSDKMETPFDETEEMKAQKEEMA